MVTKRQSGNNAWTVLANDVHVNRDHALYHFMTFIRQFFNKSDIQGLRNLTDDEMNVLGRLFWLTVVSISVISFSLLVSDIKLSSELSPIEYLVDEKIWTVGDASSRFTKASQTFVKKATILFQVPFPKMAIWFQSDMKKFEDYKTCMIRNVCDGIDKQMINMLETKNLLLKN